MPGHLLLGVVRIYSKKVEYLQHDYNVLSIDISKAYAYADINLPQDANQAKFESITLPDNFALDLMDIDDYNPNGSPDSHLRPNEEFSFAVYQNEETIRLLQDISRLLLVGMPPKIDSVISLMRQVESEEKAAAQAKAEPAISGLDVRLKVEDTCLLNRMCISRIEHLHSYSELSQTPL